MSDVAAAGVTQSNGQWLAAMDPRVYGAVGPSIAQVLRLCPGLRLAAGQRDPMVTLDHMRGIDAGARIFTGAGHNAHWEAPAAVWDFVNNKN
jgi:pimeloyl-ACP methyl ester carboxylesterase